VPTVATTLLPGIKGGGEADEEEEEDEESEGGIKPFKLSTFSYMIEHRLCHYL